MILSPFRVLWRAILHNSRFHFLNTDNSLELCRCNKFICYEGKDDHSVHDTAAGVLQ